MANVTVIVWQITDSYDSPFDASGYVVGNYIHCILDDVALTLSTQIRSSPAIGGGTLVGSPGSGPQLFFVDGGSSNNNFAGTPTPQPFWSRCDGTTLERINANNLWPYASIGLEPNSSQCQITPVCDIQISDEYSVTPASGPSTADGEVTISSTGSNGTREYSMNAGFVYGTGQTSGTFSNLIPGSYTIYSKDPIGCTDEIDITIPVTTVYGVKYRFEYGIVKGFGAVQRSRIDIEERGYAGAITGPPEHSGSPALIIRSSGDDFDKYHPVWTGTAEMSLLTSTNFQWQELHTGDDKKFKVRHYRFESADWQLKNVWFKQPSLYSEPYMDPKFNTTITLTDRIGILKDQDFLDDDGNELRQNVSLIFILSLILRKTGLLHNIRCAVDILEESMNSTADDDVFAQGYVDARIFYEDDGTPKNCEEVLSIILEPFGAYVKSALGYFWIMRQENSIGDIDYREFDSNGDFVESNTFSSLFGIYHPDNTGSTINGRFKFIEASQTLMFQQNYGKFKVVHDLMPDNNLIDSGSFELQYITETGGQLGFIDWNVFLAQAGLRYGFEAVKNGESKGAFYFDLENANVPQADNILYSQTIFVKSSVFDFSFQYYVVPEFTNFPFVRIAYQIKASPVGGGTALYLDKFGRWDGGGTAHKNELFVTSYSSWQKFEQRIPAFTSVNAAGYDIEINFFAHNHYGADASDTDFSDMRDIPTVTQFTLGKRIYYYDEAVPGSEVLRAYTLKQSFETESLPDRVRGIDYSSPSNQKVWFLDDSLDLGANQSFVRKILFDNVTFTQLVLNLLPTTYYSDAPNPITYEIVTDEFNVIPYTKEVELGDAPQGNSGALDATIPNPEIYRAWLKLSDGTPTASWFRLGVTELEPLLQILLHDIAIQYRDTTYKIVCTVQGNGYLSPVHSLEDVDNDQRKYMILGYELDDRMNAYRVTLAEVITGEAGAPPDIAAFTEGFSLGFFA